MNQCNRKIRTRLGKMGLTNGGAIRQSKIETITCPWEPFYIFSGNIKRTLNQAKQ